MVHFRRKKTIASILAFIFLLTGCASQAEIITDYGETQKTNSEIEQGSSTEGSYEHSVNVGHTLSEWLGGKEIHAQESFEIGDQIATTDFELYIASSAKEKTEKEESGYFGNCIMDTEELPVWQASGVAKDSLKEDEIVKKLFGETGKRITGNVSMSQENPVTAAAMDLYYNYVEEVPDEVRFGEGRTPESVPASFEGDDFFWHIYEGTYLGTDVQLLIGFVGEKHQAQIVMYPENPGSIIGEPQCNTVLMSYANKVLVSSDGGYSGEMVSLTSLSKEGNRTKSNEDNLKQSAVDFIKNTLGYDPGPLVRVRDSQGETSELVFSPGIEENGDAGTCVVDGYAAHVYWEFGSQSIYVDGKMPANSGYLWMTDKGVIGASLYIAYDFKECLTDQATILTFKDILNAMEVGLKDKLPASMVNGMSSIILNSLTFAYYPSRSRNDPSEYTFIPVWVISVNGQSNNNGGIQQKSLGIAIFNAIDGNLMDIDFSEE